MAYCRECGAYVPDGQTKCLACGFDEAEYEKKKSARYSGAYAYETEPEAELERDTAREKREKIREEAKKWAEEESRRRKEAAAENERDVNYKPPKQKSSTDTSKIFAALSYLSVLFVLPYIFAPNDGFARYHGKQGLTLFIAGIIAELAGNLLGLGWAVTLARLYLIYKGMMNALEGRAEPLPWIGKLLK